MLSTAAKKLFLFSKSVEKDLRTPSFWTSVAFRSQKSEGVYSHYVIECDEIWFFDYYSIYLVHEG